MTYQPTKLDVVTDLRRCIYASYSEKKFSDPNFKTFFDHAMKILKNKKIDNEIIKRLKKSQNEKLDENKRREDLLTASILLQN